MPEFVQIAKLDWLVWMTSLLGTACLGISTGLAIAIGMALLFVIYESAYPHTAMLGKLPHTNVYRFSWRPPPLPSIWGPLRNGCEAEIVSLGPNCCTDSE